MRVAVGSVLVLTCTLLVGTHGDESEAISAVAMTTTTTTQAGSDDASYITATFWPGKMGLAYDWRSGRVNNVVEGSQADDGGVQMGMVMDSIDGDPYAADLLIHRINGQSLYKVTFKQGATTIATTTSASTSSRTSSSSSTETVKKTSAVTATSSATSTIADTSSTTSSTTGTTTTETTTTETTTTKTATSTSTTTGPCFEDYTSWQPLDMADTFPSAEEDASTCQKRCASVHGCDHFTFVNWTKQCHLQDAYAFKVPHDLLAISGPFSCWGGIENQQDFVDAGDLKYLPIEVACLEMGVTYSPIMGVPTYFRLSGAKGSLNRHAIESCRVHCGNTTGCKHFTMQFPAGLCRLSGANGKQLRNWQNAVSGEPGGCVSEDFIMKSEKFSDRIRAAGVTNKLALVPLALLVSVSLLVLGSVHSAMKRVGRRQQGITVFSRMSQEDAALLDSPVNSEAALSP